jgi:hypothetical protein
VLAWFAINAAFSSEPPSFRNTVMPVARNAPDRAKQRPLGIGGNAGAVDIGMKERFGVVVAGHVMQLAAFFMQPHPEAAVLHEDILHGHADDGPDAREAVEHEGDQRLVAEIDVRGVSDAIKQGAHFGRIEDRRFAFGLCG